MKPREKEKLINCVLLPLLLLSTVVSLIWLTRALSENERLNADNQTLRSRAVQLTADLIDLRQVEAQNLEMRIEGRKLYVLSNRQATFIRVRGLEEDYKTTSLFDLFAGTDEDWNTPTPIVP